MGSVFIMRIARESQTAVKLRTLTVTFAERTSGVTPSSDHVDERSSSHGGGVKNSGAPKSVPEVALEYCMSVRVH